MDDDYSPRGSISPQPQPQLQAKPNSICRFIRSWLHMDEAEQQLLHEFNHETARSMVGMASVSTEPDGLILSPLSQPLNPLDALQTALITGRFSDLTVVHGSRRWNAHKVVLGSQSSILESRIEKLEEPTSLSLTEYDYDAAVKMMEYMYTGGYTTFDQEPDFSLDIHTKIFALAIKLDIAALAFLSGTKFRTTLSTKVHDLEVYFQTVLNVYEVTSARTPLLRQAVVEAAVIEMRNILEDPTVKGRFYEVTAALPEFQTDVLMALLQSNPVEVEIQTLCELCGPVREDEPYEIAVECRGCGKERTMGFF